MPRYRVEVSLPETVADERINFSVRMFGSHFASHAKWQEKSNGQYTGKMMIEAGSRRQAMGVIPPTMRAYAHVH